MMRCNPSYQFGRGVEHIGPLYHSPYLIQHGRGIGNIFGGLFRHLLPLAKSGLSLLRDQTIKTGRDVIHDVLAGKTIRDSLYDQTQNAVGSLAQRGINKLKKMQSGRGFLLRSDRRAIKGPSYGSRMLVGLRKRNALKLDSVNTAKPSTPRKRRRRRNHKRKKTVNPRRKKKTSCRKFQTGQGRRQIKKKKRAGRRKGGRKTARSIDIFDI